MAVWQNSIFWHTALFFARMASVLSECHGFGFGMPDAVA
jgi:hypothetical protein